MLCVNTKETLKFRVNRYLSRNHDDQEIVRELAAMRYGQETLPRKIYETRIGKRMYQNTNKHSHR